MIEENERMVRDKLSFFHDEKINIHVVRKNKEFWNGYLKEQKSDDVWIFQERVLGEVFLFVSDIHEVEEFRSEGR